MDDTPAPEVPSQRLSTFVSRPTYSPSKTGPTVWPFTNADVLATGIGPDAGDLAHAAATTNPSARNARATFFIWPLHMGGIATDGQHLDASLNFLITRLDLDTLLPLAPQVSRFVWQTQGSGKSLTMFFAARTLWNHPDLHQRIAVNTAT